MTPEQQQLIVQEALSLADDVKVVGQIDARPVIVGDTDSNYYITLGDYYLMITKGTFIAYNAEGKRVTVQFRNGKPVNIEFPPKNTTKIDIQLNTFTE